MSQRAAHCPACGAAAEGRFCARCGQSLADPPVAVRTCPSCGMAAGPDALYCGACGTPVAARPSRPMRERLPWMLSGLALVAFAIAISLLIGESTGERAEGMPPTGAVIAGPGAAGAGEAGGMDPSSVDLSNMSAREAADRLFDRAMRSESAGDTARARFFAAMGIRAYSTLPSGELDADARFHVGLLELMAGDPAAARRSADAVLAGAPGHLLAWILLARIADVRDDETALAEAHEGFLAALEAERAAGRPEYEQHAALIDEHARRLGATP